VWRQRLCGRLNAATQLVIKADIEPRWSLSIVRMHGHPSAVVALWDTYVGIVSDAKWPGMYRLKRADGSLSDMVNLTRAREALASFAERERP
jgi:hypothetical protein